jgi:SAM-dependent methyltransferase
MVSRFIELVSCLLFPNYLKNRWINRIDQTLQLDNFDIDDMSKFLVDIVIPLKPSESIVELGCHDGKRLAALKKFLNNSNVVFEGIDVNSSVIEFGKLKYKHLNNFNLEVADLFDFIKKREFELVFTYATLMYIHPFKLRALLESLINQSKIVVVIEPVTSYKILTVFPRRNSSYTHNYKNIFKGIIENRNIHCKTIELPKNLWKPKYGVPYAYIISNNDKF